MSAYVSCRVCGTGFEASTEDIRAGRWRLCPRCRHDGEAADEPADGDRLTPPESTTDPAESGSARSPRGPPS